MDAAEARAQQVLVVVKSTHVGLPPSCTYLAQAATQAKFTQDEGPSYVFLPIFSPKP